MGQESEGTPAIHELSSDLNKLRYVWILVSNLVATIFTVGLLRAWAVIRTWRYLADHTHMRTSGSLDNLVAEVGAEGRAASAEFFDIQGIDFGL